MAYKRESWIKNELEEGKYHERPSVAIQKAAGDQSAPVDPTKSKWLTSLSCEFDQLETTEQNCQDAPLPPPLPPPPPPLRPSVRHAPPSAGKSISGSVVYLYYTGRAPVFWSRCWHLRRRM